MINVDADDFKIIARSNFEAFAEEIIEKKLSAESAFDLASKYSAGLWVTLENWKPITHEEIKAHDRSHHTP